jgi:uncharacterized membrane protein
MRRRSGDLSTPRAGGLSLGALRPSPDGDAFGRFSEEVARFFGTARFLFVQTILVAFWIALNTLALFNAIRWDKYPFILLNLMFSTQAAYAAPLILLAQNRQADRERASVEEDREVASRTQADAEFLGRELSSLRITMSDVVTSDDLTSVVEQVRDALSRLESRLESLVGGVLSPNAAAGASAAGAPAVSGSVSGSGSSVRPDAAGAPNASDDPLDPDSSGAPGPAA